MAHGFSGEPVAHPATLPVHDPARGDVIDELPIDDAAAVEAAVARARAAQPAWAAMPVRERGRLLRRARRELVRARGEILERLERETGKARFDVVGELMGVCLDLGGLVRRAPRWLATEKVSARPLFGQARPGRLPAARRRRHHQPVERAAQSRARRRRARAARRQRRGDQALGADAARRAARGRGDEARAAARRPAGRSSAPARRARRWSTTST